MGGVGSCFRVPFGVLWVILAQTRDPPLPPYTGVWVRVLCARADMCAPTFFEGVFSLFRERGSVFVEVGYFQVSI